MALLTCCQMVAAVDQREDKSDRIGTVHSLKNVHVDNFADRIRTDCTRGCHWHMAAGKVHQLQARSTTFQPSIDYWPEYETSRIGWLLTRE
jgi:hypothetical protein